MVFSNPSLCDTGAVLYSVGLASQFGQVVILVNAYNITGKDEDEYHTFQINTLGA